MFSTTCSDKHPRLFLALLICSLSLLFSTGSSLAAIPADNWTVGLLAGHSWNPGSVDGTGIMANFSGLHGLAVDSSGTLYAADTLNHRIRKITSAGVVTTVAGSVRGYLDGTGTGAKFSYPQFLALDSSNNLYVSETVYNDNYSTATHQIRKVTAAGTVTKVPVSLSGRVQSMAFYGTNKDKLAVCIGGSVYSITPSSGAIVPLTFSGQTVSGLRLSGAASGVLYIAKDNGLGVSMLSADGATLSVQSFSPGLLPQGTLAAFTVDASGAYYLSCSQYASHMAGIFRIDPTRTTGGWLVGGQAYENNWWNSDVSTGNGSNVTIHDFIYGMAVSPNGILTFAERGYVPFNSPADFNYGYVYSGPCTVRSVLPIRVTRQPSAQTLTSTQLAETMSVAVTAGSVTYQWYKSGLPISGGTLSTYKPVVSAKTVPGIYNVEVVVGSGSDRASYFSEAIPVRVTNSVVEEVRTSIVNATALTADSVLSAAKTKTASLASSNGEAAFINAAATVASLWSDPATTALAKKLGFDGALNPLDFTAL